MKNKNKKGDKNERIRLYDPYCIILESNDFTAIIHTTTPTPVINRYKAICPVDLWCIARIKATKRTITNLKDKVRQYHVHDDWFKNSEDLSLEILNFKKNNAKPDEEGDQDGY